MITIAPIPHTEPSALREPRLILMSDFLKEGGSSARDKGEGRPTYLGKREGVSCDEKAPASYSLSTVRRHDLNGVHIHLPTSTFDHTRISQRTK